MNTNAKEQENSVARSIHSAVDRASESAHSAVNKAMGAADSAAGWVSERGQSVKAAPTQLMSKSTEYVTANPWKALGIAVVAGVVLSKIAF